MKLLIATKNRGKVQEIRALMGVGLQKNVEVLTLADVPVSADPREDGRTFQENARIKALHYAQAHKMLCVADDSGLSVEALGGSPGVRSARYAGEGASDAANNAHLLHELAEHPRPWRAAFVCAAAAALPGRVVAEAAGTLPGQIVPEPRGQEGFGYDPVFLVDSTWNTLAALPPAEKNRISHRGQAMRALIEELKAAGILG